MEHEWSPERAAELARRAGIEALGDRHWLVIACAREEAARRGPMPGLVRIQLLTGLGREELQRLFPGDVRTLIARIAGLSMPPRAARRSQPAGSKRRRNMRKSHAATGWFVVASLLVSLSAPALATNGMYLAGYGGEAAGRGGANLAVADRSLGLQANPAGIAQLQGQHFGFDLQLLAPHLSYGGDPFGNSLAGEDAVFAMPSLTYVRGGHETPWTWGVGLLSQGGMGATFEGYRTPFGTIDGTHSEVRYLTAAPTVAYSLNEDLAVGASGHFGYSDVRFRFWPNTSFYSDGGTPNDPSDDVGFFGANLSKRAKAWNSSARLGVLWRVHSTVQLGAIYQTETRGDYEDGVLSLNMSAIGLDQVRYDARVDGFTWPAHFGFGVQLRPTERVMLAADVRRHLWSDAMRRIVVEGANPDQPAPFSRVVMPFTFNWGDEWVTSLGAELRATETLLLRGGYNFGHSPVPDATLNPLFPATTEQHATLGVGWTLRATTLNLAVERAFEARQRNTNPDPNVNPFGPGSFVDHSQWTFSLGFSRAFSR